MSGDGFIQHDAAWAMSKAIVGIFEPLLRPEEVKDAFDEVYDAVKSGLSVYDAKRGDMLKRLKPLNN